MAYSVTFPANGQFAYPVTVTAPDNWVPAAYHVSTCPDCGEVVEAYSPADPRIVHRATGWATCASALTLAA